MSRSAAVLPLAALVALVGCFQLTPKNCQILCNQNEGCPGNLNCVTQPGSGLPYGICVSPGNTCPPLTSVSDAGMNRMDSGTSDAGDAGGPQAPTMLCHNGSCFTLPEAVRSKLVLLLWPSTLPPVGSTVSRWADQSGRGNDAHALDSAALPTVIPDGVHLDPSQLGTGFVVLNNPSLDFASGDFAVIIVSGLSSSPPRLVTLVAKSDRARTNSRQIAIDWLMGDPQTGHPQGAVDDTLLPASTDVAQPSVATYSLSRSVDHVELHLNGVVVSSADLPTPGLSTTNNDDLYLGVTSAVAEPVDSIEAVVAIRGSIGSTDLNDLETFLRTVFAKSGP